MGAGRSLLDPAVTAGVLDRVRHRGEEDKMAQLTDREQDILELVAEGKANKEISEQVNLSDKTVKNYVSNILGKLEVSRRSQAAAYMAERLSKRGFLQ